jgi:hypothetical protein
MFCDILYVVWHWRFKLTVTFWNFYMLWWSYVMWCLRYETLTLWYSTICEATLIDVMLCCFVAVPLRMLYPFVQPKVKKIRERVPLCFGCFSPRPPLTPSCSPTIREYWNIEWFIEGQAFSPSYNLVPRPSPSHPLPSVNLASDTPGDREARQFADGRGERGWARSRIIRPQESPVLYKSFNTLCPSMQGNRRPASMSIGCILKLCKYFCCWRLFVRALFTWWWGVPAFHILRQAPGGGGVEWGGGEGVECRGGGEKERGTIESLKECRGGGETERGTI